MMLKLQTMKVCLALILILLCGMAQAQTNYLFGNLSSFSQLSRSNVVMTLQNITPKKRTVNNVLISDDPITNSTDVFGNFGFTNVIYAKYSLTTGDSQSTTWILYVGTNTIGSIPIASLITNSAAAPPNPGTNYYTISQINALLAGFSGGGGSATNVLFGTTQNIYFSLLGATNYANLFGVLTNSTTGNAATATTAATVSATDTNNIVLAAGKAISGSNYLNSASPLNGANLAAASVPDSALNSTFLKNNQTITVSGDYNATGTTSLSLTGPRSAAWTNAIAFLMTNGAAANGYVLTSTNNGLGFFWALPSSGGAIAMGGVVTNQSSATIFSQSGSNIISQLALLAITNNFGTNYWVINGNNPTSGGGVNPSLTTNAIGLNDIGQSGNAPLFFNIRGQSAMELGNFLGGAGTDGSFSPNLILNPIEATKNRGAGFYPLMPNMISGDQPFVNAPWGSSVLGGGSNVIYNTGSGAGWMNDGSAAVGYSDNTVLGGYGNSISNSALSMVGGFYATVRPNHFGSFVWADSSSPSRTSTTSSNQFLIRAVGGIMLNTNVAIPNGINIGGTLNANAITINGVAITQSSGSPLTNTVFGTQTNLSDSTNKLQIHYLYTNGMPWYSVLTTNQ